MFIKYNMKSFIYILSLKRKKFVLNNIRRVGKLFFCKGPNSKYISFHGSRSTHIFL